MSTHMDARGSREAPPAPKLTTRRSPEGGPVLFAVDDDVVVLDLLREIAGGMGWTVRGFTRLSELRATLDRVAPTLLILDDDLPDGRGGDLARALREDPRMDNVPLIVCTGAHPMRQAEITGWAPVISKPFDLTEVERLLAGTARREGLRTRADHASSYERAG
jgi:DNA-binding response OmpR family regulator